MSAPVLVALFTFIDGLTQGIYGTIFNLMLRTGGLPTSAVGNIISSNLWGCIHWFVLRARCEKYERKRSDNDTIVTSSLVRIGSLPLRYYPRYYVLFSRWVLSCNSHYNVNDIGDENVFRE